MKKLKFFKKIRFWWRFPDDWYQILDDLHVRLNSTYVLNDEIRATLVPELKKCIEFIQKEKERKTAIILGADKLTKKKKGGKNAE